MFTQFAVMDANVAGILHDDGIYISLAKSLADGKGYRLTSLPTSPIQLKYPILYPGVLAILWQLRPSFPENIALLKAFNVIVLFVGVLVSHRFLRRSATPSGFDAVCYAFLFAVCPPVFTLTRVTLSDTLFLVLTIGALAFQRVRGTAGTIGLATAAAAAYLTRTLGVALIVAFAIWFVRHRSYRSLLIFVGVTGILISPWWWWQHAQGTAGSASALFAYYVAYEPHSHACVVMWSDVSAATGIVRANLRYAAESLDAFFLLGAIPGLRIVVGFVFLAGMYESFREGIGVHHLWVALYVLMIIGWPWQPTRLMMPVIPVALLFLVQGTHAVERWLRVWQDHLSARIVFWLPRVPILTMVLLVFVWLSLYVRADPNLDVRPAWERYENYWPGFSESFRWIRANTAPGDILGTAYDPMYYLYTGRQGVLPWLYKPSTSYGRAFADLGDVAQIRRELDRLGVRYLVIDPLDGYEQAESSASFFEHLLESYPAKPELVFTSFDGRHLIYRLPRDMRP